MSTGALDPLIHDPEKLRIVATLAALPSSRPRSKAAPSRLDPRRVIMNQDGLDPVLCT